jgi:hypothetical protein
MNAQERLKQQNIIKAVLEGIDRKTQEAVTVKNQFRKAMSDIEAQKKVFLPDEIERLTAKEKQSFVAKMQAMSDDISSRFDDLLKLINERDLSLNLDNPALGNALTLIAMSKNDLPFETKVQINSVFANDQSSLRALQSAYKSADVKSNAGLDGMIYNSSEVIGKLKEFAAQSFTPDGSLNFFGNEFSKLASLEGQVTVKMPDEQGFMQTMRTGAGLS